MQLAVLQEYLRSQAVDGWLLYNFRDLNPSPSAWPDYLRAARGAGSVDP